METSHISALQSRHEGLERRLQEEQRRPAPDTAKIMDLKKRKLRLKEAMAHH